MQAFLLHGLNCKVCDKNNSRIINPTSTRCAEGGGVSRGSQGRQLHHCHMWLVKHITRQLSQSSHTPTVRESDLQSESEEDTDASLSLHLRTQSQFNHFKVEKLLLDRGIVAVVIK